MRINLRQVFRRNTKPKEKYEIRGGPEHVSTHPPPGVYVVIGYEIYSGTSWLVHKSPSRQDAIDEADMMNQKRKDPFDNYYIAYDSEGKIVREPESLHKHPGIAV